MNIFNPYILSLLTTEGKFSCLKSAHNLQYLSHDYLNRSVHNFTYNPFTPIEKLPQGGTLIFDDSTIDKSYSKNIEGTSFVYSSSDKKFVFGYCFINVIWVYEGITYFIKTIVWKKGGKTKNELIREVLKEIKDKNITPKLVMFDLWYAACDTLNVLNDWDWKYISMIKTNRIFNGEKVKEHKFYGGRSKYGKARGIGHIVQVVKHSERYLLTNLDKPLTTRSAWNLYEKRWIIETIFRDLKSILHLEESSTRSLKAQINHISACAGCYKILKERYGNMSMESAHREFLEEFRRLKYTGGNIFAMAA